MEQINPNPPDQQQLNTMMALANLQRRVKSGASNFYWIAGLSLVNTLIYLFGLSYTFVIGLGLTQFVDGIAQGISQSLPGYALIVKGFGLFIDILIAGAFVLFGFFAAKGHSWAFVTGMIVYLLDAILMLLVGDFFALAFHLFFLWSLFSGFQALRKLKKITPPASTFPSFPRTDGV